LLGGIRKVEFATPNRARSTKSTKSPDRKLGGVRIRSVFWSAGYEPCAIERVVTVPLHRVGECPPDAPCGVGPEPPLGATPDPRISPTSARPPLPALPAWP